MNLQFKMAVSKSTRKSIERKKANYIAVSLEAKCKANQKMMLQKHGERRQGVYMFL